MLKYVSNYVPIGGLITMVFPAPYINIKKSIVPFTSERFQMVCESEDDLA